MSSKTKLIVLSLVFLLSAPSFTLAQSVPQLAQKALAATVFLEVQDENGETLGQGSGFFVRHDLIATNFHVIDGAAKGIAKLVNKETAYPVEGLAATDETNDLALLKVTIHGVTPLPLGDSNKVQIGETVYVAGNPLGFEGTFSDGVISGRRNVAINKERLQMTAPISPGSSGGPVLNRKGQVIGVSTSFYNPILGQNLNFAVPSKALKELLPRPVEADPLPYGKATGSYKTHLLRGIEKMSSGDYEEASREFTHAISLSLNSAIAYIGRGDAKYKLERYSEAFTDYDIAIQLKPYASAYKGRGNVRHKWKEYTKAIADYDEAIRLDPNDANAYIKRGYAKSGLELYFDAVLDFVEAIHLDSNDADAYFGRGLMWHAVNDGKMAREDFETALRLATLADDQSLKTDIEKAIRQLDQ